MIHIRRCAALFVNIHLLISLKFVEHEGLDLVSKIPSSEGPSKQTRRAYTEKLKMLNASATLLPTTSSASTRRRKGSIDCTIPTAAMSAPVPRANGKGKGRATQAGTDEYLSALLQQTSLGQNYDAIVSALPPPTSSDGSTTRRRPNGGISSRKTNFKEDEKKVGSTSGLALEPQDEGGRSNTVARKSSRIDETTNQSATHPSSKVYMEIFNWIDAYLASAKTTSKYPTREP